MPTRGYSSYHGRRSLWKILLALLLVLLLTAAGAFLLLQDYIVYESDGSIRLELPIGGREPGHSGGGSGSRPGGAGDGGPGGAAELPPVEILPRDEPEEPEPLRASILTAAALCDADADPLSALREAGRTGLVVEMKGDNGVFYYTSPRALKDTAVPAAVTDSQMSAVLSRREDLTAVAQLSCFHDSAYAFSDMAGAGV